MKKFLSSALDRAFLLFASLYRKFLEKQIVSEFDKDFSLRLDRLNAILDE